MVIVFSPCAPAACILSLCTLISQADNKAVVIQVFINSFVNVAITTIIKFVSRQITLQIHSGQIEMPHIIAQACMPDAVVNISFVKVTIVKCNRAGSHIFELSVAGSSLQALSQLAFYCQAPILAAISNITSFSINAIIYHKRYYSNIISCLACKAFYLNLVAIRQLQTISTGIIDIAVSNYQVITACTYCHAAQLAVYISALEACIFITGIIIQVLNILQHAGVGPVIINHTVNPDAGTDICHMVGIIAQNSVTSV